MGPMSSQPYMPLFGTMTSRSSAPTCRRGSEQCQHPVRSRLVISGVEITVTRKGLDAQVH
jgi:hypothetical protein